MQIKKKLLFTPGPVPIPSHILALGSEQPPYNRTPEFSEFTQEILEGLEHVFQTQGSVALLTASGTAAMEAAVLNLLGSSDKALVVNGGTFGERWCQLCVIHSIPFEEIKLEPGRDLDLLQLQKKLSKGGFTALLINAHETYRSPVRHRGDWQDRERIRSAFCGGRHQHDRRGSVFHG